MLSRNTITPDDRGNPVSVKTETLAGSSEIKFNYTYDGINLTELIIQYKAATDPDFVNMTRSLFSDFQIFNLATGTNDPVLNAHAQIYPNPVSRDLRLELPEANLRGAEVSLYNITGQKVYEHTEQEDFPSTLTINMSTLPKGVYLLRLITADNRSLTAGWCEINFSSDNLYNNPCGKDHRRDYLFILA